MIEYEDIDDALYVGGEDDGCYVKVGQDPTGYFYTVIVDSETGHFVDTLATDMGPFKTYDEAQAEGKGIAFDWCVTNGVEPFDEPRE